jgi:hypothetical protein
MSRARRSNDWGFPRWRGYEGAREAAKLRLCDRAGWDYFAGLTAEEAAAREAEERRDDSGYRESAHYAWAGPGDGSRSRDELRALDLLGLEPDADFDAVRKAWRGKAKEVHPDVRPNDAEAAKAFQALQLAYEVLRAAEERREWKG